MKGELQEHSAGSALQPQRAIKTIGIVLICCMSGAEDLILVFGLQVKKLASFGNVHVLL